jgi:hypothetical protein
MWLFTKHGFYSIVRKSAEEYHIRARVKQDLQNLKDLLELTDPIHESRSADYRYRLVVGKKVYLSVMALVTRSVDYENFKNKVSMTEDQMGKLKAYHEIWALMEELQREGREPKS